MQPDELEGLLASTPVRTLPSRVRQRIQRRLTREKTSLFQRRVSIAAALVMSLAAAIAAFAAARITVSEGEPEQSRASARIVNCRIVPRVDLGPRELNIQRWRVLTPTQKGDS